MKRYFKIGFCAAIVALMVFIFTSDSVAKDAKMKGVSTCSMLGAAVRTGARRQSIFAGLRKKFPGNPVIEEGEIRMESYLVNGQSEYRFYHKEDSNKSATEIRLAEQDLFKIMDIGFFLMLEDSAVPGIGVLQTYPNPLVFPEEAGQVVTTHLEHVYNGRLQIKVGDTTWSNGRPIRECRVVNTAQQTSATNSSEYLAGNGFIGCTPNFEIKGREKVDFLLKVPANVVHKIQSATTKKIKVVCILKGYTVSGAGGNI